MTYGVEYWGPALVSALGSAFNARSTNAANMAINAASEEQAWDMYHGSQAYNSREAEIAREFNLVESNKQREFASASANEQMGFQERMRATQYQTAVKDMQAAGLNPMLAYSQGGAGTPPGASANGASAQGVAASSPAGTVPSKLAMQKPDFSSLLNSAGAVIGLEQQKANVELTRAQAEETASRVPYNMQHTRSLEVQAQDIIDKKPLIEAELNQMQAGAFKDQIDAELKGAMQQLVRAQEETEKGRPAFMQTQVALNRIEAVLKRAGIPEAKASEGLWSTLDSAGKGEGGMGAAAKALMMLKGLFK